MQKVYPDEVEVSREEVGLSLQVQSAESGMTQLHVEICRWKERTSTSIASRAYTSDYI